MPNGKKKLPFMSSVMMVAASSSVPGYGDWLDFEERKPAMVIAMGLGEVVSYARRRCRWRRNRR
ncbi:hypothetical protein NSPZN2_70249 [Nitrospira defluvii]|uniref:Uncharacterized protein n=1 Tax=Nitrospira defluvii TaxID=330214 RepID=A0ABM8SBA9_9BACT|nr:hypothetical protein NSPZN2_70249 [Nitrospira defluvii]